MDDFILGKNLKSLRQNKNITQPELAKRIGISLSSIQKHEAGSGISKRLLEKYVKFYGCDRNWLLTGIGEPYIKKDREENNIPQLRKSVEEYKIGTPRLGQAVDMLAKVLESGNQVFIQAVMSSLIASSHAVNAAKQQGQQISNLRFEFDVVCRRLAALEKRLEKESDLEKQETVEKKAM